MLRLKRGLQIHLGLFIVFFQLRFLGKKFLRFFFHGANPFLESFTLLVLQDGGRSEVSYEEPHGRPLLSHDLVAKLEVKIQFKNRKY